MRKTYLLSVFAALLIIVLSLGNSRQSAGNLNETLYAILEEHGFTGDIQNQLEDRLGRKLDKRKIELGRLIFFDEGLGLHQDNSCAGCHAPGFGFGDSQSIAIGVDNNDTVGIHRMGPRNQRRAPSVLNTAFYPKLMWNGRFASLSDDPFDNSMGFEFPPPEGDSLFNGQYNYVYHLKHLLMAQAHIPFTELPEMAGFTATSNLPIAFSRFSGLTPPDKVYPGEKRKTQPLLFFPVNATSTERTSSCPEPDFSQFDDGEGYPVPPVDPYYNSSNFGIRSAVLDLINSNPAYISLFRKIYPQVAHAPVDFIMVSEVIAEFEFFLTYAKAPLDKFAAGNKNAMTQAQKRGALIFFGKGNCVSCHAVSGTSNQMFSDFNEHNVGTPQIYPIFGDGTGNVPFSDINCPNKSATGRLDYGREEFTGYMEDRYKFRSSPLRNVKLQSSFFHNGSFKDLKKAILYHLDPAGNINTYSTSANGVSPDLHFNASDMPNVMVSLDPALVLGIHLTPAESDDLFVFVSDALHDQKATPEKLKALIPKTVPSGVPVAIFEDPDTDQITTITVEKAKVVINEPEENTANKLSARIESNPAYDHFSVTLSGETNTEIRLTIMDMNGNLKEVRTDIESGEVIEFGQTYHSGFYLAEIIQGKNRISLKLIKL